ncbi:hypothetical protein llap_10804 [Limosa lapponica baueri]|uniref:Uncharacterized protein n=1 Tax=Limosa lapponica baueri TaxID=1758121 RepID=A0A2I0TYI8_LIMLA|nr:hypothetical protein llap_10804 [Limosa lapponica baueri]
MAADQLSELKDFGAGCGRARAEDLELWSEEVETGRPSLPFCGFSAGGVNVFLVLGISELDTVLHVGSHQSGMEGQNHLPRLAGHSSFDAAQDMVGFSGLQSHQVFDAWEALIIGVATELAFKSCSMCICQGYRQHWRFIIMTQAYQELEFFATKPELNCLKYALGNVSSFAMYLIIPILYILRLCVVPVMVALCADCFAIESSVEYIASADQTVPFAYF